MLAVAVSFRMEGHHSAVLDSRSWGLKDLVRRRAVSLAAVQRVSMVIGELTRKYAPAMALDLSSP